MLRIELFSPKINSDTKYWIEFIICSILFYQGLLSTNNPCQKLRNPEQPDTAEQHRGLTTKATIITKDAFCSIIQYKYLAKSSANFNHRVKNK